MVDNGAAHIQIFASFGLQKSFIADITTAKKQCSTVYRSTDNFHLP